MPWTRVALITMLVTTGFGVLLLLSIAAGEAFVTHLRPSPLHVLPVQSIYQPPTQILDLLHHPHHINPGNVTTQVRTTVTACVPVDLIPDQPFRAASSSSTL
jgi:hypothetical protein